MIQKPDSNLGPHLQPMWCTTFFTEYLWASGNSLGPPPLTSCSVEAKVRKKESKAGQRQTTVTEGNSWALLPLSQEKAPRLLHSRCPAQPLPFQFLSCNLVLASHLPTCDFSSSHPPPPAYLCKCLSTYHLRPAEQHPARFSFLVPSLEGKKQLPNASRNLQHTVGHFLPHFLPSVF